MNRVVITGVGITSNLGHSFAEVAKSLQLGKGIIKIDEERQKNGFRSSLTSKLPPFPDTYGLQKDMMSEAAYYAAITWRKVLEECGWNENEFAKNNVGVVVGNDSASDPVEEIFSTVSEHKDTRKLGKNIAYKAMNSACSNVLTSMVGSSGLSLTISAACASGAHAVGYGHSLIQTGMQDAVIAGGFQEMNWLSMSSFDALGAFSDYKDPMQASRPFDGKRTGLVPGGGGAIIVLESLERAKANNHKIFGEVIAFSFSSDGSHLTVPSGEGAQRCISDAIDTAGISLSDIDYINAHATSTPVGDLVEASVINKVFGENGPIVSSTKSMTGHECWMSGASEIIYSLAMMHYNFIAPNINFEQQEEDAPKINITNKTIHGQPNIILSNSFGFGGTNACIILKRFE
ncbi:beta-ketoacyl synthase [Candidatus Uabimicrobium sp. HlEnr_7]|uniref:beta-ketoacyl-[acyl-carrier-protein] synthase family protein n=1 Tax=Candidatus Uabimicrobium helgolandensis TaxID=3095367 RepID=UPI003556A345